MRATSRGLYHKYRITKTDGTPTDSAASYFPLRLDTDHHARVAARAYAESVREENPCLCNDLHEEVDIIVSEIERAQDTGF